MCIIVAVPKNVQMPSTDTLQECFRSNPDGAGFMWADGKRVRIRKGFMTWNDFADALNAEEIPEGSAIVLHFRIATHGKVQPMCCHPFPVSSEPDDLRATSIDARFGVAHNGVIQGRATNDKWSDSMDFVAEVVAPLSRICPGFIRNSNAEELLEGACRSKLAIMDHSGELLLVGSFHEQDGVYYSNTSYIPVTHNWSSYRSLWDGWTDSTYYDRPWDDDEKLVEYLPWNACKFCEMAEECAGWEPVCETEDMAEQACSYYANLDDEEYDEMFGMERVYEE